MNIPFVLLPPWRGKVGMGGAGSGRLSVPCVSLSPPPSPVKGEGIEEVESLPEIALFLEPPYFVAHAFPVVAAFGGRPMALHVVPPGVNDERPGDHDHGDIPVQDFYTPGHKLFEFRRVRLTGRRGDESIEFRVGVWDEVVAAIRLVRVGAVVCYVRQRHTERE